MNKERYQWRNVSYVLLIVMIVIINMFFNFFVWNPYDLSPNFAIGFFSSLMLFLIIYNIGKDREEFYKWNFEDRTKYSGCKPFSEKEYREYPHHLRPLRNGRSWIK